MSAVLDDMLRELAKANETLFNPKRGKSDPRACEQAERNGGFWGPFLP